MSASAISAIKISDFGFQRISPEDQQKITELKARDAEVRQHEQAHLRAAGQYATSGASFEYEVAPDGQQYAIGGEVSLDISPVANDPKATIRKAETIKKAALAPAQPSGQDYRVAARADQMKAKAEQELKSEQSYNHSGEVVSHKEAPQIFDFSV
jgi:hypothetical protein